MVEIINLIHILQTDYSVILNFMLLLAFRRLLEEADL